MDELELPSPGGAERTRLGEGVTVAVEAAESEEEVEEFEPSERLKKILLLLV